MSLRERMEKRLRDELSDAGEQLLQAPDSDQAKARLERVTRYRRFIDLLPPPAAPERRLAIAIGLGSTLVVAALWLLPTSSVDFFLDIRTREVGLRPDGQFEALDRNLIGVTQELTLEGLSSIEGAGLSVARDADLVARRISASAIHLQRLVVNEPGEIVLNREREDFVIEVRNGEIDGALLVQGLADGATMRGAHDPDEWQTVRFGRRGPGAVPIRLTFKGAEWRGPLTGVKLKGIDFLHQRRDPTAGRRFASAVEGGRVTVLGTNAEYEVHAGDILRVEGLEAERIVIRFGDALNVSIVGRASGLELGPEDWERDLRPRLLELIARDAHWALVWSGILFISGILWNLRKLLGGRA